MCRPPNMRIPRVTVTRIRKLLRRVSDRLHVLRITCAYHTGHRVQFNIKRFCVVSVYTFPVDNSITLTYATHTIKIKCISYVWYA